MNNDGDSVNNFTFTHTGQGTVAKINYTGNTTFNGSQHIFGTSANSSNTLTITTGNASSGGLRSKLYVGNKIEILTDQEGGNIRLYPRDRDSINTTTVNYWEIDAYNGNLRFYRNSDNGTNTAVLSLTENNGITLSTPLAVTYGGTGANSAAQGYRNLMCRGSINSSTTIKDFNNILDEGVYWIDNNSGNVGNAPNTAFSYGWLEVFCSDTGNGSRVQRFTVFSSATSGQNARVWTRWYQNSKWYNWFPEADMQYSTSDITAGTTTLRPGALYFVYE